MGRPPCCDKSNVKRGLWTAEEDAKILAHVSKHGTGNWTSVPKKAGLNRCGKSCRLRWTNYLRPDLNHDDFTPQEEDHIINLHQVVGSRWSLIAKQLPGRTDNDVKNYWNTKLRKKLSKMGIDPLTHKPFSQIFSEFGNISSAARHHALPEPDPPSSVITTTLSPAFFFSESISSSTCSSASSSLVASPTLINWSDYLLHDNDPYQIGETPQQERPDEIRGLFESDVGSNNVLGGQALECPSSADSFVDSILDRDSEMRSTAFPEFLDENLEYY